MIGAILLEDLGNVDAFDDATFIVHIRIVTLTEKHIKNIMSAAALRVKFYF